MSINFNTHNLIIFQYPTGAGGKFVAACCGLSDNMILNNGILAQRQINQKLSKKDKLDYLIKSITGITTWNDFNLGCNQLFGIAIDAYDKILDCEIEPRITPVIAKLQHTDLKFSIVAHTPYVCKLGVNKWPNARIVQFNHNKEFYNKFRPDQAWFDEQAPLNLPNNIFYWDQRKTLDLQNLLLQLKELYNWLGLEDFDSRSITEFYNCYIDVISKIKNSHHETSIKAG
jgi:hypothetical protein